MRSQCFLAALALVLTSLSARADSFNFSFGTIASAFSGSGVLTTGTLVAPGEYDIASVTGSAATGPNAGSLAIQSILAPGSFPTPTNGGSFPANDNVLFAFGALGTLSSDGVSFILSDASQINLYNPGGSGNGSDAFLERASGVTLSEAVPVTITRATTPEPSSIALLGSGLACAVGCLRRRSATCL